MAISFALQQNCENPANVDFISLLVTNFPEY